ncbi:DUF58 domain-containing protein [Faecalibacter bovis]|uniref:DUF58 domain-containing protein n=1 Tax=Faecalibacter bovis TaxID=2898187 RepID=A0ABX7XB50_9FLAO|nr:DUF58 domain-containing protein [Faecalibacter bovis]QTV05136.1 DUF58 domain-containing protein [Faecalibacter bovis]
MKWFKNIYLKNQFFYALIGLAAAFVVSFFFKSLFPIIKFGLILLLLILIIDFIVLFFTNKTVYTERIYPERFSNGDFNDLKIKIQNQYKLNLNFRLIEELPIQFQKRDFEKHVRLKKGENKTISYRLRPTQRGEYTFGNLNVFVSFLGFFERKIIQQEHLNIKTYPSYLQMRQYTLLATTNQLHQIGIKRIRRIGSNTEFENIKPYSRGDEYRLINWKATGKAHKLMVNQYQEEKSQPVYNIIDLGRSMRMPFNELTLLDYAINSSLVLSNVTLVKDEKAGLITFNKKVENHILADKKNHQMQVILEALYATKTDFKETDFGRLYSYTKKKLPQRSLLFLYTNFESLDALERQIQYLKLIKKSHVLVVIMFKNTELNTYAQSKPDNVMDIYRQTIAEKINFEKELIINKLHRYGIHTIYTEPSELTVNSINKYLELKARGLF